MKKTDIIISFGLLLYTVLFWQQWAGLNFLLFSIAVVAMVLWKKPEVRQRRAWQATAAGVVFSGFWVMYNGTTLATLANLIALSLLSVQSSTPGASVFIGLFHSIYSYITAFVYALIGFAERLKRVGEKSQEQVENQADRRGRLFLMLTPVLLLLVFFFLYRGANPVFEKLTNEINLDFISIPWLLFMILGFLLLHGFFHHQTIREVESYDQNAPNRLMPSPPFTWVDKLLSLVNEHRSALLLLGLLNALLLFVNLIDINYLYLAAELPEGMNYSDMVHQSVATLIVSILLAIGVILFYFRGRLNFYENSRLLKVFTHLWIAQNILLVVATAYRNGLYIDEYSLTFKRIGVYVWLLLTLIGLLFTIYKVATKRSNWFLVRSTGWAFLTVLLLSASVNWTQVVTQFNIDQSIAQSKPLDFEYLKRLGAANLPQLIDYRTRQVQSPSAFGYASEYNLEHNIARFVSDYEQGDWRSLCIQKKEVYEQLLQYEKQGLISIDRTLIQQWQYADSGYYYDR